MNIKVFEFPSGLRLVWQPSEAHVAHCGLMIGAGSRNEITGKEGLAHFIEHVLFKGTKKRKAWQVLTRLEAVGGELNAYTTREETCVHASFMKEHLERSVELIADIVQHSVFPDKEIEKEKEVVLDEILSYQDNPMEQIYDDFECQVFRGHPLGSPVLGTEASVRGFSRSDILSFVKEHYHPSKMVFSYSGPHSYTEVLELMRKHFAAGRKNTADAGSSVKRIRGAAEVVRQLPVKQTHFITGGAAYGYKDKRRYPMFLLNNILGGPGMNSRLNMNIREKYGFTYNIESGFVPYRETGLFTVYLATEKKHFIKTRELVGKELKRLREDMIGTTQLSLHKKQMKGQIAISQEHRANVMLGNAKSVLNYGRPVDLADVFRKIDAVTAVEIMDAANDVLSADSMGSLLFSPV